jgi:type I restriction enzyme S subunit
MSFSDWEVFKLGDLIKDKPKNGLYKSKEFQNNETGNRWIKMNEVYSLTKLTNQECELISVNSSEEERFGCLEGDILFGRTSLTLSGIGKSLYVDKIDDVPIYESNLFRIRPNKNKVIPKFLSYYFRSSIGINSVQSIANQTAATSIKGSDLNELDVKIPNISTQKKITDILSSLDDKIELNRQTNKTLETLAQTLFKEMCVSKSEVLPDGWRVEKLDNLIETVSITHKMKQEEIIFLNTSDILEGNVLNKDYSVVSTLPGQAKKSIKRNDILFSEIRPANKRYAFVNFDADDYVVSTKLMVLRSKGINPYLIYCFLTNNDTLKELQHLAETRSGTFPQITFTQLKDFKLVIPDETTLNKVSKNIQDIYENIFLNNKETQTLTVLRDSLLPKLMNGEIAL